MGMGPGFRDPATGPGAFGLSLSSWPSELCYLLSVALRAGSSGKNKAWQELSPARKSRELLPGAAILENQNGRLRQNSKAQRDQGLNREGSPRPEQCLGQG